MSLLGQDHETGNNLEHYQEGDEATSKHRRGSDADLQRYEDDEVKTAPWGPKLS